MASPPSTLAAWAAHARYRRIAGWIATHTKLLRQCDNLTTDAHAALDAARVGLRRPFTQAVAQLGEIMETLELTLDAHSNLEDRKLFPFLEQRFASLRGMNRAYADEHHALDAHVEWLSDAVGKLAKTEPSSRHTHVRALLARVGPFAALLRQHLLREEQQCVELWLSLTDEQEGAYDAFKPVRAPPRDAELSAAAGTHEARARL